LLPIALRGRTSLLSLRQGCCLYAKLPAIAYSKGALDFYPQLYYGHQRELSRDRPWLSLPRQQSAWR
jgi:hypothetical protein